MEEIIEINLVKLAKNKLNINEYLTLLKIYKNIQDGDIPFYSSQNYLDILEKSEWLIQTEDDISLTNKSLNLFEQNNQNKVGIKQFDELFNIYPYRTNNGRVLRAKNKVIAGNLTRDYIVIKNRYLRKVKDIKLHESVIEATKKMIELANRKGSLDYLQKLETYINQNTWEQYMNLDEKIDTNNNLFKL